MCSVPWRAASMGFPSPRMNKYKFERAGEHRETPWVFPGPGFSLAKLPVIAGAAERFTPWARPLCSEHSSGRLLCSQCWLSLEMGTSPGFTIWIQPLVPGARRRLMLLLCWQSLLELPSAKLTYDLYCCFLRLICVSCLPDPVSGPSEDAECGVRFCFASKTF